MQAHYLQEAADISKASARLRRRQVRWRDGVPARAQISRQRSGSHWCVGFRSSDFGYARCFAKRWVDK
jgi:hypothetical protein